MFEFMKIINETRYRHLNNYGNSFQSLKKLIRILLRDHGKSDVSRKLRNHMLWLNM